MFEEFYENGKLNSCVRENYICLIQKKEDAILVKDFVPISLTTLVYKLVAMVLAERLKKVMPRIIAPTQSAFIWGRQILDPVLIANEVVEEYKIKKKKGWMLKLDLKKAFDCVDWEFLEKVLVGKKIDPKWISWIMGCVSNPKFSIFIRGRIQASRGIRQGDPLSPFLFLLVSEVLSGLLSRLHEKGKYEGFVVGKDVVHVSVLQFADDTLIFCKYDDDMLENLRKTIELFEWCSGQKVNWEKSALCGLNIEDRKLILVAAKLNCKVDYLPFMYLALPLGGYPKKRSFLAADHWEDSRQIG